MRRAEIIDQYDACVCNLVAKDLRSDIMIFRQKRALRGEGFLNNRLIARIFTPLRDVDDVVTLRAKRFHGDGDNVRVSAEAQLFGGDRLTVGVRASGESCGIEEARVDVRILEGWIGGQDFLTRRAIGEHVEDHCRRYAAAADDGLAAHLSGFGHNPRQKLQFVLSRHSRHSAISALSGKMV